MYIIYTYLLVCSYLLMQDLLLIKRKEKKKKINIILERKSDLWQ